MRPLTIWRCVGFVEQKVFDAGRVFERSQTRDIGGQHAHSTVN